MDVQLASQQQWDMIMSSSVLHTGPAKRAALLDLVRFWAAAHPVDRWVRAGESSGWPWFWSLQGRLAYVAMLMGA